MSDVNNVSSKLTKAMIEALEASPHFEGKDHTTCVICLSSENPNPSQPVDDTIEGQIDILKLVLQDKIRIGDGTVEIYGNFHEDLLDPDYERNRELSAVLHTLQDIAPILVPYFDQLEGLSEVYETICVACDGLLNVMRGKPFDGDEYEEGE